MPAYITLSLQLRPDPILQREFKLKRVPIHDPRIHLAAALPRVPSAVRCLNRLCQPALLDPPAEDLGVDVRARLAALARPHGVLEEVHRRRDVRVHEDRSAREERRDRRRVALLDIAEGAAERG